MKKLMMLITMKAIVVLFSMTLNAQTNVPTTNANDLVKKNKLTYNLVYVFDYAPVNISYERVFNSQFSLTAAVGFFNNTKKDDLVFGTTNTTQSFYRYSLSDLLKPVTWFTADARIPKSRVNEYNQKGQNMSLGLRFYPKKKNGLNRNQFYLEPELTVINYSTDLEVVIVEEDTYAREYKINTETIQNIKRTNFSAKLNLGYQLIGQSGLTFDISSGFGLTGKDGYGYEEITDEWISTEQFGTTTATTVEDNFIVDFEVKMGYAF